MDPKTLTVVLVIAFLILSLGVHEAAHAWVANLCGDDTAKRQGRLTLNPISHIDPFMTIVLPAVLFLVAGMPFGGAKPVPVNPMNLRHPLRDMSFVALAGPVSNFLQALLFAVAVKVMVYSLEMDPTTLAPTVMMIGIYMNLLLAVFNMIPVPPLDGSRVMAYLLPSGLRESYVSLERFGLLIVFALFYFGVLRDVLSSTVGIMGTNLAGDIVIISGPLYEFVWTLTGGVW